MDIVLDDLYVILADTARRKRQITYEELSQEYFARTKDPHDPHGTWDEPLGTLNQMLNALFWPPLSAVVVLKSGENAGEPGGLFWGSSSNIPKRPSNDLARIAEYSRLLGLVHQAKWPPSIPVTRP